MPLELSQRQSRPCANTLGRGVETQIALVGAYNLQSKLAQGFSAFSPAQSGTQAICQIDMKMQNTSSW